MELNNAAECTAIEGYYKLLVTARNLLSPNEYESFREDIDEIISDEMNHREKLSYWSTVFSKIKTKSKPLKFFLTFLSAFKFPAPALEFSNGKFKVHSIYF